MLLCKHDIPIALSLVLGVENVITTNFSYATMRKFQESMIGVVLPLIIFLFQKSLTNQIGLNINSIYIGHHYLNKSTWTICIFHTLCLLCIICIDIVLSRLVVGFQKVCIIRLPQCTNTTLNFVLRIAHNWQPFIQTKFSQVL